MADRAPLTLAQQAEEDSHREGGVVYPDRPQICVEIDNRSGDVFISTAGISDDFSMIEMKEVTIPADCAEEVANAILALIQRWPNKRRSVVL